MKKDKFPEFPDSSEPIFSTNVVDIILMVLFALFGAGLLLNLI